MKEIIGKKLGMTQVFDPKGAMIPVTVVEAGPCTILQKKTVERDGYEAVVTAYSDCRESLLNEPKKGTLKKGNCPPKRHIKELSVADFAAAEVGKEIKCDIFSAGDAVDVSGLTRGRGFTGTIQRWNQHRLKETHGVGPVHREVGSMGSNSTPSRVLKCKRMPGQYGHENVTIQNLEIVKVDAARNVLLIKGGIPGPKGSLIRVRTSVKAGK
ncbi:MAG: 50S ribosomal protein L3 [Clostridiales bacterium]|jgi:large subunit ribosomal protein L3|nr:50S ribosomal protein L3 [Clostridiales bacterium]